MKTEKDFSFKAFLKAIYHTIRSLKFKSIDPINQGAVVVLVTLFSSLVILAVLGIYLMYALIFVVPAYGYLIYKGWQQEKIDSGEGWLGQNGQ